MGVWGHYIHADRDIFMLRSMSLKNVEQAGLCRLLLFQEVLVPKTAGRMRQFKTMLLLATGTSILEVFIFTLLSVLGIWPRTWLLNCKDWISTQGRCSSNKVIYKFISYRHVPFKIKNQQLTQVPVNFTCLNPMKSLLNPRKSCAIKSPLNPIKSSVNHHFCC